MTERNQRRLRVVIPGGSGHVETILARALERDGHEVIVLSRAPPWKTILWDGEKPGDWVSALDGADVVINLTGRNVNCRYGPGKTDHVMASASRCDHGIVREVYDSIDARRVADFNRMKLNLRKSTALLFRG